MSSATHAFNPESVPAKRTRGRSSSPGEPPENSPLSVRSRSEDRNAQSRRARDEVRMPSYLNQTPFEVKEKFEELEWMQRKRLLDGHQDPGPSSRWAREQAFEAKLRNRYMNVEPWANNRIHLKVPPDCCDYINASPIAVQSSKTKETTRYIATQGPKQGQFNHIWRMIWQETSDPAVIVMLTQTSEAGRDKCFQYFPEDFDNDTLTYDGEDDFGDGFVATVRLLESSADSSSRSTIRKLVLSVGDESKTVWHLLFAGWPDFSIPEGEDRAALVELIKLSEQRNSTSTNPRIVHCSAGVGRSGTFITLDHLLREMEEGSLVEPPSTPPPDTDVVFETVNHLREQRMTMVQSEAQLNFIYQLLNEWWAKRYNVTTSAANASAALIMPSLVEGDDDTMAESIAIEEDEQNTPEWKESSGPRSSSADDRLPEAGA
ncbi:MAG: hypothetical protein M1837_005188 [Sclerophora amabilis]|nr:MAG: hypothetical protein M1837_005188 [Sclerophora amabilis]